METLEREVMTSNERALNTAGTPVPPPTEISAFPAFVQSLAKSFQNKKTLSTSKYNRTYSYYM